MKIQSEDTREELIRRLRRIEGQVRGIQRMLEEDRECREIVQQMNAAEAAMRTAQGTFIRSHARECLLNSTDLNTAERSELVDELFGLIANAQK